MGVVIIIFDGKSIRLSCHNKPVISFAIRVINLISENLLLHRHVQVYWEGYVKPDIKYFLNTLHPYLTSSVTLARISRFIQNSFTHTHIRKPTHKLDQ